MYFKVEVLKNTPDEDRVYIEAVNQDQAEIILEHRMGPIPPTLLTWAEVSATQIPDGEDLLS